MWFAILKFLIFVFLASSLAACAGGADRERGVIETLSDNGCTITVFRTETGPRDRSKIEAICRANPGAH